MEIISLGIIFGLLAMLGYGISNGMSGPVVKRIGAVETVFWRNLAVATGVLLALIIYYALGLLGTASIWGILFTMLVAIVGYVPLALFYVSLKYAPVGVAAPIGGVGVVVTVALSILWYGDIFSQWQFASICAIILGVILISIDPKEWNNKALVNYHKGIMLALVAAILWGLVFFLFRVSVGMVGPIYASFIIEAGIFLLAGLHLFMMKKRPYFPRDLKKTILWLGILGATGTLAYNLGITFIQGSIIASLAGASPFVAALYGLFILKEKLNILQIGAGIIIVLGVIGLSML